MILKEKESQEQIVEEYNQEPAEVGEKEEYHQEHSASKESMVEGKEKPIKVGERKDNSQEPAEMGERKEYSREHAMVGEIEEYSQEPTNQWRAREMRDKWIGEEHDDMAEMRTRTLMMKKIQMEWEERERD